MSISQPQGLRFEDTVRTYRLHEGHVSLWLWVVLIAIQAVVSSQAVHKGARGGVHGLQLCRAGRLLQQVVHSPLQLLQGLLTRARPLGQGLGQVLGQGQG